jgi:hypothetical protein
MIPFSSDWRSNTSRQRYGVAATVLLIRLIFTEVAWVSDAVAFAKEWI